MVLQQILSDVELAKIEAFRSDKVMLEAVRKVLLFGVYNNGTIQPDAEAAPTRNFALALAFRKDVSNDQLGADLRAAAEGIRAVESAFEEFISYRPTPQPSGKKANKAL